MSKAQEKPVVQTTQVQLQQKVEYDLTKRFPMQSPSSRFSDILLKGVLNSTYYHEIKHLTYQELLPQIVQHVQSVEPWVKQAVGVPSSLSCIVYRLMEIPLTEADVLEMLFS